MTVGIYKLNFTGTDKVYIGQSRDSVENRFKKHIRDFVNKTHSIKMNAAYAEFGMPSMEILTECFIEELNSFENETIEIYNAVNNGFNTLYRAEDTPHVDCYGELNGRSKFSNAQIIEVLFAIVDTPTLSLSEISLLTGVSLTMVAQVSKGVSHKWLSKEYPEKYLILLALKSGLRRELTYKNRSKTYYESSSFKSTRIVYPEIICPLGNVYSVTNVSGFAREHGLDTANLTNVLKGKNKTIKGWRLNQSAL